MTDPRAEPSHVNQLSLLKTRRFLPLFVTQALGAFNDNALRGAVAILITFDLVNKFPTMNINAFVLAGTAVFVLPYFLFSSLAGQIADMMDKAVIARWVKVAEAFAMLFGAVALWSDNPYYYLIVLFFAGLLSTFFAPTKYGSLPEYLHKDEVIAGNALIEMGTFVTILLGTMWGNELVLNPKGRVVLCVSLVLLSVVAIYAAWLMPPLPPKGKETKINWNIASETWKLMGYVRERRDVFWAVMGASWLWFIGIVMLAQMSIFAKDVLHGNESVTTAMLALFTIGIGAGSMATNKLLGGEISPRFVPFASLMMTVFMIDIYISSGPVTAHFAGTSGNSVSTFFSYWESWRVSFDIMATGFFSGIYAVPLNAIMQVKAPPSKRARIIAGNSVMNSLFMVTATIICAVLLHWLNIRDLYLIVALLNIIAVGIAIWLLPEDSFSMCLYGLFRLFYRLEVKGWENFRAAGRRSVIIANHSSLLDGPMLASILPNRSTYAVTAGFADVWWMKPARKTFDISAIDPANPMAIRTLVDKLKKGERVVIFPEGRTTTTGGLMKIYEGPATIADMADAKLLPVRISGTQYTPFSRLKGKLRIRWFPKVTITFLPPVELDRPPDLKRSDLRHHQAKQLYSVMTNMMFVTSGYRSTLFNSLLEARRINGGSRLIVEDIQRKPLSYDKVVMGAVVLGRKIAQVTPGENNLGIMLPNMVATVVTFFALHATGRVPAMLNFSAGAKNMVAACKAAELRTIITSKKFIESAELQEQLAELQAVCKILYLEDVRGKIGFSDKLFGLRAKHNPQAALKSLGAAADPDQPAVILFTSGSEGAPKGVVLSHANLNANRAQAAARIDFSPADVALNSLPMFHAFGLLVTTLLPLLSGTYSFYYPSPLHFKVIPELCYQLNVTVLIGTDTFLAGYARTANAYDFYKLRLVIAGAERMKPETRDVWMEKFGVRILEGYGATECSPAIAFNTPMHNKYGTVGQFFDQIEYKLEPVEGIAEGGRLYVKGPNVMLGYVKTDKPGVLQPPPGQWYDTGDIVSVDEDGYVTIVGRAKRFAKIAGEMVSLSSVEAMLMASFPEEAFAVVAANSKKKGEQLVIFTTMKGLLQKRMADAMKKQGATELMVPRVIVPLEDLPLLGSGKTDYVTLNAKAAETTVGT